MGHRLVYGEYDAFSRESLALVECGDRGRFYLRFPRSEEVVTCPLCGARLRLRMLAVVKGGNHVLVEVGRDKDGYNYVEIVCPLTEERVTIYARGREMEAFCPYCGKRVSITIDVGLIEE